MVNSNSIRVPNFQICIDYLLHFLIYLSRDFLEMYDGGEPICFTEQKSKKLCEEKEECKLTGLISQQTIPSRQRQDNEVPEINITFTSDHVNSRKGFEIFVEFLDAGEITR